MKINNNDLLLLSKFLVGKQSIIVDYKDTDELYIYPGIVHFNNGTIDDLFELSETIEFNVGTLSASTWYYVMVTPSFGNTVLEGNLSVTTDVPTLDEVKRGYYSSDGLSRCIGYFYSNASSNIRPFTNYDCLYQFDIRTWDFSGVSQLNSYKAHTLIYIPLVPINALLEGNIDFNGTATAIKYSKDGTYEAVRTMYIGNSISYAKGLTWMYITDSSKRFWIYGGLNNLHTLGVIAFEMPREIYNTY